MRNPREMRLELGLATETDREQARSAIVHALGHEFETRFAVWSLEPTIDDVAAGDRGEPSFHSTIVEMTRDEKEALGFAIRQWIEKPGRWIWAGEKEMGH